MAATGIAARGAVVELLTGVLADRVAIDDLARRAGFLALDPADRARAQRLALTVLRNLDRADAVLKPHLHRAPPPRVRAILRLGAVEICAGGAAPHGVVNAAVALARAGGRKAEGFAGLVNAVLRKVADTGPAAWPGLPVQQLPGWLRGRLMSAWGKAAVQAMEAAHAAGAPVDLTAKDGDAATLAAATGGAALPTGSVRLAAGATVSTLPGFETGDFWVQDAAAALPARALRARPGERVLDLCAAPGGKTLQLAAVGADVTALDISGARLARLKENLARCGLAAHTVLADALDWAPGEAFDAVLLDAPCSATGTIRRHPDLPHLRDPATLKQMFALQAALLDRAAALTRPGGRLVIATCSLLPEEGEGLLAGALARHGDLAPDPAALDLPGVEPGWRAPGGGLRTRPDFWAGRGGIDGFFIAALRKT